MGLEFIWIQTKVVENFYFHNIYFSSCSFELNCRKSRENLNRWKCKCDFIKVFWLHCGIICTWCLYVYGVMSSCNMHNTTYYNTLYCNDTCSCKSFELFRTLEMVGNILNWRGINMLLFNKHLSEFNWRQIHRKKSFVNPICALMFNNSITGSEFIFNGSKTSFGN